MQLKIKNNIFLMHYDYVTIWINQEKYNLKYNFEITKNILNTDEKIEIVYAIFSRKSKKIYISCKNKEVLSLSLKLNLFSLILDIINFIMHILIFMIVFTIFSSGFNCLFFIVIYIFFSFFINLFLAVKRISLVEN